PLVPGIDAIIAGSDQYNEKVLAAADRLKIIARVGVGFDAVDLEAATRRGVVVSTTPGTNHEAVADCAFSLILALARHVTFHNSVVKEGRWDRRSGDDVWGQTLGILGLGKVGKAVARRGRGFSMRIIAYDPFWDDEF